jgi:dinuclear metal center YbgI/SA1388 family protein
VGALAAALEMVAPARLAETWDNVGLLLGDPAAPCARVLATVDLTGEVLSEAMDLRANAVVAYHPPIFDPLKRLAASDPRQRVLLQAASAGIALLSPHTALDACRQGVNDWLAEGVAGSWREVERAKGYEPLRPAMDLPGGEAFKVVVFAPPEAVPALREAMAEAGAGVIGRYDRCSTAAPVAGTFRGLAGSRPAVGRAGRVEQVAEERLEMVASRERLGWALAALRAVHPYETPAFEVHALAARPSLDEGQGRLLVLRRPATAREIAARLRRHLGVRRVEVAAPPGGERARHERIGLCAGAGFSLAAEAFARGATLFLTGEARHHDQLACTARGATLLLAGHTNTERGYLPRLCERLAAHVPGAWFTCSRTDRHPLRDA